MRRPLSVLIAIVAVLVTARALHAQLSRETLESVAALRPHITGTFRQPAGFTRLRSGSYLVFDRAGHSVHRIDAAMTNVERLVAIGHEPGKVIQPVAFSAAPDGSFVIADAPLGRRRIQVFTADGMRLRGFYLPGRFPPSSC